MAARSRLGVRAFLFVVLGASAAVPVALLGGYQAQRLTERELATTERRASAAAWSAAEQLTLAMESHANAAASLAAQVAARGSLAPEALGPVLRAHMTTQPDFLGAYVATASGVSLLHCGPAGDLLPGGVDYRDRDYYQALLATHAPAVSGAAIGRVTHVLSVQLAAPILGAAGELTGFTCSSLNLGTITDQAVRNVRGMVDGRLIFLDAQGRRIADSDAPSHAQPEDVSKLPLFAPVRAFMGEPRSGLDDRGRRVRAVAVGLGGRVDGWRVFAMTPESSVAAQARRVRVEAGVAALGSLLAALALAAWLASWLARPLHGLAGASEAVTRGEFENVPPPARW